MTDEPPKKKPHRTRRSKWAIRDLFDKPPKHDDDPAERSRVYGRIAPLVLEFSRIRSGDTFHMEGLRRYVLRDAPDIAPDSPGRILRELRLERRLNYVVINRRASLYQFRPV